MKKISLAALTCLVALISLQPQGAEAAPQATRLPSSSTPVALGTDLKCKLEVSTNSAMTQPLTNGGFVTNLEYVWVRATVRNQGVAEAKAFSTDLSILKNSTSAHASSPELTIPGGFSMQFPVVKVYVGHSGKLDAKLQVDTDGEIAEIVETNNTCTFTVQSQKLH